MRNFKNIVDNSNLINLKGFMLILVQQFVYDQHFKNTFKDKLFL